MDKNYNLNLPDWGPYNKKYLGAAHVAGKEKGLMFDLNLFTPPDISAEVLCQCVIWQTAVQR